ncbi:diacylglycerol/lipid kinase family protein [Janibacter sp. GS2]|uniref:diacylglycerol/lipid kinase family protein n=1 Tax=Janibacter sp. GS2 TaxID=3442646 RepID=UPI003EBCD649
MRRFLFIANASAGSSDRARLDEALAILRAEGDVRVVTTDTLDELTDAVAARDGREVVVAGGDGSLNAFVTALCRTGGLGQDPPTVGLLPMGTGNDFARTLGLPTDSTEAARVIVSGRAQPVDVLIDDDQRIVTNAVHMGVGEEAGRIAAPWKERLGALHLGALGYVIGGVAAGFGQRGRHLRVVADDRVVVSGDHRVLQVAVTIGRTVGGGTPIAPGAKPGDGRAEVVVSRAISPSRRLRYAFRVNRGRHTELDDVISLRARTVTVTGMHEKVGANADGEALDPVRERSWRVVPDAYRLHSRRETS